MRGLIYIIKTHILACQKRTYMLYCGLGNFSSKSFIESNRMGDGGKYWIGHTVVSSFFSNYVFVYYNFLDNTFDI
jgi:hypothetical protein